MRAVPVFKSTRVESGVRAVFTGPHVAKPTGEEPSMVGFTQEKEYRQDKVMTPHQPVVVLRTREEKIRCKKTESVTRKKVVKSKKAKIKSDSSSFA